jgi:hypothetical protein
VLSHNSNGTCILLAKFIFKRQWDNNYLEAFVLRSYSLGYLYSEESLSAAVELYTQRGMIDTHRAWSEQATTLFRSRSYEGGCSISW